MITIYSAGLINKPERAHNRNFAKKVSKKLKKTLKVHKRNINSQELNTFLILSARIDNGALFGTSLIDSIESEVIYNNFRNYYLKNVENLFRSRLKKDRELKETSGIVKNFLTFIDSKLTDNFNKKLNKINEDLPLAFRDIACKTLITLWDNSEEQSYRFSLAGLDRPFIVSNPECGVIDVLDVLDKFIILNLFLTFLEPSIERLKSMSGILDKLEEVWGDPLSHIKVSDPKLQKKADLYFRILLAKLNALSELEQLYYRIFNLFIVPKIILSQLNLCSMDFIMINEILDRLETEVTKGKELLHSVASSIDRCQSCFSDYLDKTIQVTDSTKEFRDSLHALAEVSVDLFIEAESLKIWADFFGRDIPHFSFDTLGTREEEFHDISTGTILAVRRLFKNYNLGTTTVYAVRGVSFDIKEGEFIAVTGSSGAGKTTLLNCMAGLDTPDYGSVIFRGKKLSDMPDKDKSKARLDDMGFIFQSYALLPHYTTRENVALPAELANLDVELRDRVEELLVGVGIDLQANQFPAQLSGGQLQRVAIARALTNNPAIIFADEPTGDLDSVTGKQVMDLLKKFHETTGTTVVIITHDPDVAAYAERELKMVDGVIK